MSFNKLAIDQVDLKNKRVVRCMKHAREHAYA